MKQFSIRFLLEVTVFTSLICLVLFGTTGEVGFYLMISLQLIILALILMGLVHGEADTRAFCFGCLPFQIVCVITFCFLTDASIFVESMSKFSIGNSNSPFYAVPDATSTGHIPAFFAFALPMLLSGFCSIYLFRRIQSTKTDRGTGTGEVKS